ncbi:uncharacterized protein N7506_006331 [Penicillium brevicompactum]|uniref:uncharacterized protein n=1 Tax=Penicillium brevicompactum TaxID=5074 RepID=UPI00254191F9|nr:uncharacterized protein N7506_006331 [Penicillium brevicompactum]KAJ5332548.1 hypothetical protein N7506_006331 [Penicillium brevicompactum]
MAVMSEKQATPDYEEFLKTFTSTCLQKGLLDRPDSLELKDSCDGLLDQPTLLRFLTARKFDNDEAVKHFEAAHKFREQKHIIRLYDLIQIADFESARSMFFHWTGRRGKEGHPICFFDLDCLDKSALARWDTSSTAAYWHYSQIDTAPPNPHVLQLTSVFIDSLSRFVVPLCSMMPDRVGQSGPITGSIYLADGSNIGLKMAWSVKYFAQHVSWLLSTCYPETIEKIFVCNVPSYFPTVWRYLKPYVDPFTAQKVVFLLPSEVLPTLREYVDDANIPVQLGGGHSFTHGQLPDLEDRIQQYLGLDNTNRALPQGPIKWIQETDGRKTALAVGSEAGSERNDRIATVRVSQ